MEATSLSAAMREADEVLESPGDMEPHLHRPTKMIPRYAAPNISSVLPEYANAEQDYIRRAFANGNYDTINLLPDALRPNEVNKSRLAQQQLGASRMLLAHALPGGAGGSSLYAVPKATNKNGLFHEFEYIPSRYSLPAELATGDRVASDIARAAVSETPFVPAGTVAALRHQDPFAPDLQSPFKHAGDPFETAQDVALRARWVEESRILSGPFLPAGNSKLEDAPTKAMALHMIEDLHRTICADWEEAEVMIAVDDAELWVVRFKADTVDSAEGLLAYMNVLVRCNEHVQKYGLTKAADRWNVVDAESISFALKPRWIRQRADAAFFSLHPEHRSYKGLLAASAAASAERV